MSCISFSVGVSIARREAVAVCTRPLRAAAPCPPAGCCDTHLSFQGRHFSAHAAWDGGCNRIFNWVVVLSGIPALGWTAS